MSPSPSDVADDELQQALLLCLSKPQEPLSSTLRKAPDPEAFPASLDHVALGQPLPQFSDDVQQRVLSLYVMALQCGNYRVEPGGQLLHTFSDGFWCPVLERLIQGMLERFHKEKKQHQTLWQWADESGVVMPSTRRSRTAVMELPLESRHLPAGLPDPEEPRAFREVRKKPATILQVHTSRGCHLCSMAKVAGPTPGGPPVSSGLSASTSLRRTNACPT